MAREIIRAKQDIAVLVGSRYYKASNVEFPLEASDDIILGPEIPGKDTVTATLELYRESDTAAFQETTSPKINLVNLDEYDRKTVASGPCP